MKNSIVLIVLFFFNTMINSQNNNSIIRLPMTELGHYCKFDFRYLNYISKQSINSEEINKVYNSLLYFYRYNKEMVDYIKFIRTTRNDLKENNQTWIFDTAEDGYKKIAELLLSEKKLDFITPIIIGLSQQTWVWSGCRNDFLSSFKRSDGEIKIGELVKTKTDTYIFSVSGYMLSESDKGTFYFCLTKIDSPLFEKINNKYQLNLIIESSPELSETDIKAIDYVRIGYEENIIYGVEEQNYDFEINTDCLVTVEDLLLRSDPLLGSDIIIS